MGLLHKSKDSFIFYKNTIIKIPAKETVPAMGNEPKSRKGFVGGEPQQQQQQQQQQ